MPVLVFRIVLKSNYHLGAGYGNGFGIDSALFREDDRRPVIRGTTLCGLLRDGARRLMQLPAMEKYRGKEEEILARLFGGPAEVKPWRIGSAYPVDEKAEDSQAVRRVRIDPVIRRAEPQKLFSQEEGLAGEVFVFRVECPENTASTLDEAAFLVAAARNVRRLGRSRHRGLGECVIHLAEIEGIDATQKSRDEEWETWFLRRFQEKWLKGTPAPPATARPARPEVIASTPAKWEPVHILIVARLDEPVLVAGQSPAGNQYETRQYIPGSTLLGALAAMAVKRSSLEYSEGYRDFVSLFRREAVIFPTLYPASYFRGHLYPAVPAPRGLLTCSIKPFHGTQKEGHGIYPAFGLEGKTGKSCRKCGGKMEPLGGFLVLYRDTRIYEPLGRMEMHIRIDDQSGRAKRGDLFGYTLLAAGQYFLGEMICAHKEAWEKLKGLCGLEEGKPVPLFLGKGRQRGYGRASLLFVPSKGPAPWIQKPLAERVPDKPEVVSLTLLTDTIIADSWGRQATGFEPEWLEKELGLGPVEILEAYAQTGVVDGFNTTLGLPRWRDLALAAGSVVWLHFKEFPPEGQERMRELEAKGLGLRRNEGFGRIAFNHPLYKGWQELRDSAVWLPEEMRISERTISNDEDAWQVKLNKVSTFDFKDERFLSLARWLYFNSVLPPEELVEKLRSFGSPDEGLKDFVGGEEEFGMHDKESFFKKDKEKEKVEGIIGLLEELQKQFSPDYHRAAIRLLAEHLGGTILQKKGE